MKKHYEEYKNMKEGTFDFKKYIDNQEEIRRKIKWKKVK